MENAANPAASHAVDHGSVYHPEDRRKHPRKRMQRQVAFMLGNQQTLVGKSIEISRDGIGVMFAKPLSKGVEGTLRFDFYFNGHRAQVTGAAKVMNCCCSGLDGFRVGLTLAIRDADAQGLIDEFLSA